MNQSLEIGSQQDFNKFVGSTAVGANTINQNPSEFDAMHARLSADASKAQETANQEKTTAYKALERYDNNAAAPEGIMNPEATVPESPQELQAQTPVAENETNQLVQQ